MRFNNSEKRKREREKRKREREKKKGVIVLEIVTCEKKGVSRLSGVNQFCFW